ncbi:thioredoxin-dependent thiol peroxidase [Pyxidicoccus caerfyrddinensis]|uniref:thioredoxin-dependent thiol peroxidase n=1 Tax=Pyxidicoccus caerfyrddinensis TaxID=2709663 RepID=UPI0023DDADEC|nr:thioredoxin-dependent thiol peroxidase [Pyxidicoccus caerfyrddinensis]
MPQAGDQAPGFQLQDQDGKSVTLSQHAGKNVVLYFYPKDDTPGCTTEACNFRDEHSALGAAGAVVLGVSADSVDRHRKFASKYSLPFPLLADPEHKALEAYGVWGEKSLYGRKFQGITRTTFLIGPDGRVKQVWPKVKVSGHVDEVLAALGAKGGSGTAAPTKKAASAKTPAPAKKATGAKAVKKATSAKKVTSSKAPAKKSAARKGAAKVAARARR